MSSDRKVTSRGFTLIEVLVALAIVAFGLVAVFGQLNQSASAAQRLRDKTIAHWIALNLLTERRLLRQLPGESRESDEIEMANNRWRYAITYSNTELEGFRRADVTIARASEPDRPVASATGFLVERPADPLAGRGSWAAPAERGGNVPQPSDRLTGDGQ
jgi:general secretion pathway protein I